MTDITPPADQPEHTTAGAAVVQPEPVDLPDAPQGSYVPHGDGNYQPDGEAYAPGGAEYEAAAAAQPAQEPAPETDDEPGHDDERQYNV